MTDTSLAFAFEHIDNAPIRNWRGFPDCDAAQKFLIDRLTKIVGGTFLPPGSSLNERRKGNLGEFICWCIGQESEFSEHRSFPANAFGPLSDISKNGVDIIWLFLPDSGEKDDHAVILEVKTTVGATTAYARTMTDDFEKLFGHDPAFTLQSRFQEIKNHLEFGHGRPDLCSRVEALAGITPRECRDATLIPAVLHDLDSNPADSDLLAIRTSIAAMGWQEACINPWSVALSSLEDRLTKLSQGTA